MATVAHALTTLAKVKSQLNISDATHDAFIEQVIAYVTDWIEVACGGRRFKKTTYTNEEYNVNGGKHVYFVQWPVVSVAAIEYNSGTLGVPVWNAVAAADYFVNIKAGYVEFAYNLPIATRYIRMTYDAGYLIDFTNELTGTHTLPFDLNGLANNLVCAAFNKRFAAGAKAESTEGQSITWSDEAMTPDQMSVIAKYAEQSFG